MPSPNSRWSGLRPAALLGYFARAASGPKPLSFKTLGVTNMIIAILEDGGVMVHDSIADAQRHHEGIDVEDGSVAFFDLKGCRLKARFIEPNTRSSFVVASGRYELKPERDDRESLVAALEAAAYLDPTSLVSSLVELRDMIAGAK